HWEMMLEQAERMRALVDDLLALSRLEQDAAPASRELIDVDEILEEAVAEGRMISGGAHEIKITKVAPEGILGDFKDMRSAVTNLVTNAVRYTPKDGKIELSWEVKDDHGILSVKDNGIGIAPEHIPR
ncbi:ATP-binding protein, partial [Phocaeicola vulgatus]